jgi:hypothetical protein
MSIRSLITLNYIKSLVPDIQGNFYDTQLQADLDSLLDDIQATTGIDLSATDSVVTQVFHNTQSSFKTFVSHNTILQIGAWREITKVEEGCCDDNTYQELVYCKDYLTEIHETLQFNGVPIIRTIKKQCCSFCDGTSVRITGKKGINDGLTVPAWIVKILKTEMRNAYLLASTPDGIIKQSEKSIRYSYSYDKNQIQMLSPFVDFEDRWKNYLEKYKCIYYYHN